jgi:hypothetical protein
MPPKLVGSMTTRQNSAKKLTAQINDAFHQVLRHRPNISPKIKLSMSRSLSTTTRNGLSNEEKKWKLENELHRVLKILLLMSVVAYFYKSGTFTPGDELVRFLELLDYANTIIQARLRLLDPETLTAQITKILKLNRQQVYPFATYSAGLSAAGMGLREIFTTIMFNSPTVNIRDRIINEKFADLTSTPTHLETYFDFFSDKFYQYTRLLPKQLPTLRDALLMIDLLP